MYLDDGMTGYQVYNNSFIDCQNGLLFNGGRDNYVYDNYFQDVDFDFDFLTLTYRLRLRLRLSNSNFNLKVRLRLRLRLL